jgi:hypothetical protein
MGLYVLQKMNENYTRQHQDVRIENGIQYGDLPEFVDYEYLRKNTGLNLCNLANVTKAPAMPDSVKMDVKRLTTQLIYIGWRRLWAK